MHIYIKCPPGCINKHGRTGGANALTLDRYEFGMYVYMYIYIHIYIKGSPGCINKHGEPGRTIALTLDRYKLGMYVYISATVPEPAEARAGVF